MRDSIQKRGPSTWLSQFELERTAGKRRRYSCTVKGTYKEAQKALTEHLNAADKGMLADPTHMSVGEYVLRYLSTTLTQSPKTLERYTELAERQIIPHLGSLPLSKLRPEHIEQWHSTLLASGLAPLTVRHAHSVLKLVLGRAVENGTLSRNAAGIRKPPKVEIKEVEILAPAQVEAVLSALKGHRLHPVASLGLATGCRRGELLALEWRDVDLDRGVLRVERSLEETRSGLRVKEPKTKRGRRNIGLAADAIALLREHRKQQLELRLALGQGGQPKLVFSTIEGEHLSPNGLSRSWRQICRARKLPCVPFHALRHTHASTLIRAGVDVLTISRRLGHSTAAMTLDVYGHLIEGSDAAAAKAIEGILK
jgi:integrase